MSEAEKKLHVELAKRTPLPYMGKDGHYLRYEEVCHLVETDERDLPGNKATDLKAAKEVDASKKAIDKAKPDGIFAGSKVRATVCCDECSRPRLLYADKKRESEKLLPELTAYLEGVDYQCGDALFDDNEDDASVKKLAEIFYVKERRTCDDPVEEHFFNTFGVRGRSEFEHVCARCGKGPDESPLDEKPKGATEGRTALPLCADCKADGKAPILVGKVDATEKAAEKRKSKDEARKDKESAKKAKKASGATGSSTGGSTGGTKRKERPAPPSLRELILEALPILFGRLGETEDKVVTRSVLRCKVRAQSARMSTPFPHTRPRFPLRFM